MNEKITLERFHELTRPLIGLPISRVWRGYGSAIFLEIGELTEEEVRNVDGSPRIRRFGQAALMLEWSWRVERPQSVLFGSFSSKRRIKNQMLKLRDLIIVDVTSEGRLPEIVVQLSGGYWVHSFTTVEGQPEWCLFLERTEKSGSQIQSDRGNLIFYPTDDEISA